MDTKDDDELLISGILPFFPHLPGEGLWILSQLHLASTPGFRFWWALPDLSRERQMSDRMHQRMPDRMIEYMTDRMPNRMFEYMSDRMPNRMFEYMSDRIPNRMFEYMSDRMPNRMFEYMSDRMPNRMFEYMSDRMPSRMSEYVSDRIAVGGDHSKTVPLFFFGGCGVNFHGRPG